jgi:hypothetical protein
MSRIRYLVSYDISNPKRLRKVARSKALNDSGYGHRPPFFRHWKGMFFEIATTAPERGEAVRARQCWRSPARMLANKNRADNQVIMTAFTKLKLNFH